MSSPSPAFSGAGDDERALVFLGGSSGLSVSFFVPVLAVDLTCACDLALGAGADELLDAPVYWGGGGSCTGFNGNEVVGGNGVCCGSGPNCGPLSFCGVEVGVGV